MVKKMKENYYENMNYFEVSEEVKMKAEQSVRETGYQMLNIMKLSNHIEDHWLYLVLANNPKAIEGYQYVVWTFNGRGLDNGYYCSTFKSAFNELGYRMNDVKYQELMIKREIEENEKASKLNPYLNELKWLAYSFNDEIKDTETWVDAWERAETLTKQIEAVKDNLVEHLRTILKEQTLSDGTKLGITSRGCRKFDESKWNENYQYERYGFFIRPADRLNAIEDEDILEMFENEILNTEMKDRVAL